MLGFQFKPGSNIWLNFNIMKPSEIYKQFFIVVFITELNWIYLHIDLHSKQKKPNCCW